MSDSDNEIDLEESVTLKPEKKGGKQKFSSMTDKFFGKHKKTVKLHSGLTQMEGFENQGKDQSKTAKAVMDHFGKDTDISEDLIVCVLYCYKKAQLQTGLKREKVISNPRYIKLYSGFIEGLQQSFPEGNETLFVRCFCITFNESCKEVFDNHRSKLGSSLAIPFFFDIYGMSELLNLQLLCAASIKARTVTIKTAPYKKGMSLYSLLDSPNPKELTLTKEELMVVYGLLIKVAKVLEMEIKGYFKKGVSYSDIISSSGLNEKWGDLFATLQTGGSGPRFLPSHVGSTKKN